MKIINKLKALNFLKRSGIVMSLGLILTVGFLSTISLETNDAKLISLIVSTRNNPFFAEMITAAQKEIKKSPEFQLRVFDSTNTDEQQVKNIDLAISLGSKAVIINPVDSTTAAASGVKKLKNKNIPIISIDRGVDGVDVDVTIASDNKQGAKDLAEHFQNKILNTQTPKITLATNSIFQLKGVSGSQASNDRNSGFREIFGTNIGKSQRADFDRAAANKITSDFLVTDDQKNTKIIFAENDEMALGALTAAPPNFSPYTNAWTGFNNGDIYILGFDGTKDALIKIQNNEMFSTVIQQPGWMGEKAIQEMIYFFGNGYFNQSIIQAPTIVVDKDNVSEYLK